MSLRQAAEAVPQGASDLRQEAPYPLKIENDSNKMIITIKKSQ